MSKQDRQGVRTATDLERKYDFSLLGKSIGGIDDQKLAQLTQTVSQYITNTNQKIDDLEGQVESLAPGYNIGDGLNLEKETNTLSVNVGSGLKVGVNNELSVDQDQISESSWMAAYPIGSVYISVNATSPSTFFGGEWSECHLIVGESIACYMWERIG